MKKCFSSLFVWGAIFSFYVPPLHGAAAAGPSAVPTRDNVRYVGAVGCQSSMCHGGASPSRDQFTIWSREDFHSRAYATLVTARSARIAESLGIVSATESARCTTCHAPFAALPPGDLAPTAHAVEGVSCETCHNAAAGWLRGHTRPDWTYADRLQAGLRDLRSAYVRAETCVACHQILDPAIVKAGHPELIFELDGQDASEPRHWTEKADWFGPKAWLVGQAVALTSICTKLSLDSYDDSGSVAQQNALIWLLQQVPGVSPSEINKLSLPITTAAWSNQLARTISGQDWNSAKTRDTLAALAATSGSFTDTSVPLPERELRAERLVLGLDRLFKSLHPEPNAPGQAELSALFAAVQDRDQFNPKAFSTLLEKFAETVTPKK
ncbi:MAG TPA: cytochrome c family protein [Candidatus Methylacidiphilales bacterium]|jgi:hypothetical protein|nr:cytochrome c family protein [Candidatus Methylacidiphilales bacterium]